MAFKGRIINGRKSRVQPTGIVVRVPPELHAIVRAFAEEYHLYVTEAAAYLLSIGIAVHEGWDLRTEDVVEKYLPKPLPFKVTSKLTPEEIATRELAEQVMELGCHPDEIIISAELNPNLKQWCKEQGIPWTRGAELSIWYPKEFYTS